MSGSNLDKKDLFGKSDPYVVVNQRVGSSLVAVHQTDVIMKTLTLFGVHLLFLHRSFAAVI